jgi:hypothetical protein
MIDHNRHHVCHVPCCIVSKWIDIQVGQFYRVFDGGTGVELAESGKISAREIVLAV